MSAAKKPLVSVKKTIDRFQWNDDSRCLTKHFYTTTHESLTREEHIIRSRKDKKFKKGDFFKLLFQSRFVRVHIIYRKLLKLSLLSLLPLILRIFLTTYDLMLSSKVRLIISTRKNFITHNLY